MKKSLLSIIILFASTGQIFALDMENLNIYGFVSQGYLKSDKNDYLMADTKDGTVEFNEAALAVTSTVSNNISVGIQFMSKDLGEVGNNEVEIDWAFAEYRLNNWLGLRAGKLKRPFGFYNCTRDVDAARTSILLPQGVYSEVYRETQSAMTGASLFGTLPAGLSYQAQYGTYTVSKDGGVVKVLERAMSDMVFIVDSVDVDDNIYTGNLEWETPLRGLRLGGTYSNAAFHLNTNLGTFDFDHEVYILSTEFSYNNLLLAAEYLHSTLEIQINSNPYQKPEPCGYYGLATYRLTDWVEFGACYSESYANEKDRNGDVYKEKNQPAAKAWLKDASVMVRFDVSENWTFKMEGHFIDGLFQVDYDPEDPDRNWFLFASKVTCRF